MLLQLLLSGIAQGSIYALVALGMTALFRATTIVNFGHGELFMFGAFAVYVMINVAGLPFLPAAVLSIMLAFVLGMLIERVLIRPMGEASHLALAMMTVAVSFLLRGVARFFWGPRCATRTWRPTSPGSSAISHGLPSAGNRWWGPSQAASSRWSPSDVS